MPTPAANAARTLYCVGGSPYVHHDGIAYPVSDKGGMFSWCYPIGLGPGKWMFGTGGLEGIPLFVPHGESIMLHNGAKDWMANPWIWGAAAAAAAFLFLRR